LSALVNYIILCSFRDIFIRQLNCIIGKYLERIHNMRRTTKNKIVLFCILLWILTISAIKSSESTLYAADGFKTFDFDSDKQIHALIRTKIPDALEHTGAAAFDEHLIGVQSVLRHWRAPEMTQLAGLFHSIYGTEGFQGFKLSWTTRPEVMNVIGRQAERLVFIFCAVDRKTVDDSLDVILSDTYDGNIEKLTFRSRPELGAFPIELEDETEYLAFIELSLADWLEQVEGAAAKVNPAYGFSIGQAWGYRREAYLRMIDVLEQKGITQDQTRRLVARKMYEAVFARESPHTKSYHMRITPPLSAAAKEAREAINSRSMDYQPHIGCQTDNL
jgi:hypothetical protein